MRGSGSNSYISHVPKRNSSILYSSTLFALYIIKIHMLRTNTFDMIRSKFCIAFFENLLMKLRYYSEIALRYSFWPW